MHIDEFTLFSGSPIIYKHLAIRQPTLYEIGGIGEQAFYDNASYFLIDKDKMLEQSPNKEQLASITMTTFIMLLILEDPPMLLKINSIFRLIMNRMLIIDDKEDPIKLILIDIDEGEEDETALTLNDNDWNEIASIIKQIFCLPDKLQYNTKQSKAANRIAEQLKRSKEKIEKMKNKGEFQAMLPQYCSILSVGSHISLNEILKTYTLYQLMDELKRFNKYEEYHTQLNAMVHGAKIDKLTTWYGNLKE